MLETKLVDHTDFYAAIAKGFENDNDIFSLYDPNVTVNNLNELTDDIFLKITGWDQGYGEAIVKKGVYYNKELIGYFCYQDIQLLSFAVNIKFRSKEILDELFMLIKKEIPYFIIYLWNKNIRAIKWLNKYGMKELVNYNSIIKLQCQ